MLEIRNIDVYYGDVQVVWDISFEVKQGEVVALIGANGAGKSTTLKTVSGLLKPKKGEILFNGTSLHTVEAYHRIDHLIRLRELQDETGGFQTFIPLAFHPDNTGL